MNGGKDMVWFLQLLYYIKLEAASYSCVVWIAVF